MHIHGPLISLFLIELIPRILKGPSLLSDTTEFRMFGFSCDGFDVVEAVKNGISVFREKSFSNIDKNFVCIDANWSYIRGPLLNTKPDESLHIVQARFLELVLDSLGSVEAGDVCLLHVDPSAFFDESKNFFIRDLSSSKTTYYGKTSFKWH